MRRRYGIRLADLKGWLFLSAPGRGAGKLMTLDARGRPIVDGLTAKLESVIIARNIDIVSLDPFVKTHSVEENSNSAIDEVVQILADLADRRNIAVDAPHHVSKGLADPGNANRGRGASAMKDAARLVYTLSAMTAEEAQNFGVSEGDRKRLIRVDSAKVNICPAAAEARWFKLVGVNLDNGTDLYPNGDEVQTVEVWSPPGIWKNLSVPDVNAILNKIDLGLTDGSRYSDAPNATDRAAWRAVVAMCSDTSEGAARQIIKTWVKSGLLYKADYENVVTRKTAYGLRVDDKKRPS